MDLQTNKKLLFEDNARKKILEGVETAAKVAGSTLGPRGRLVVIERPGRAPHLTKDGITTIKVLNLKDQFANLGVQMVKNASAQTVEVAGDGPQPLYAKILTPKGWATMGDLKVGDEICGTYNTKQKILEIHPKGIKDVYEVITSDGRIVECCENHLWRITTNYGKEKILTTKQMLETGVSTIQKNGYPLYKYYIPTTSVEFENADKDLPIDPYFVGALLCKFSKKAYFNKNYLKVRFIGKESTLKEKLRSLKLLGANSHTKFIPKCYLYSTVENRQRLLEGLIDTGGHINSKGRFEYSTVSKQLCLDFIELCRSLGKQIHVSELSRKQNSSYSKTPIYRITELKGYKFGLKIKEIRKTNRKTEMQCIKVSNSDHLYITNDYVITHNTTTCAILTNSIYKEGLKLIAAGFNPTDIKKGIDKAVPIVVEQLRSNSYEIKSNDDIMHVGRVSANGDEEVGKMLAEAMEKVGQDGVITVEEAKGYKTTLEIVEGMQINRGYVSPFFVTNSEKLTAELKNPYIIITNKKFEHMKDLLPILEQIYTVKRSVLLICDDIEGEALNSLTVNKMKGTLDVCAIRAPEFGNARHDMLSDIAILTGGQIISDASGIKMSDVDIRDSNQHILGEVEKVIVGKNSTTIVAKKDNKEEIDKRVKELKTQLEDPTISQNDIDLLKRRLSRLSGGVGIIRVGGATEVEMKERKDRVDDALCATQAAVEAGVVPGGGTALIHASLFDPDLAPNVGIFKNEAEKAGARIVREACQAPLIQIAKNAGVASEIILHKIVESGKKTGWDAVNEEFVDMIEKGILDPAKVPITALENAASVASLLLTVECSIVEEDLHMTHQVMEGLANDMEQ